MNEDRDVEQLRAADPARGVDTDPHGPTGRQIRARALRVRGRARSRAPVVVAVTGVLALGGAAAIAGGVFDPDPADLAAVLDDAEAVADLHLDGWRPELSTESVLCVYEDGEAIATWASEFPLDQVLTSDDLVRECTSGNDLVRSGETPVPTATTVCGGARPLEELEERRASTGASLVAGSPEGSRYRFPVVLGWEADCDAVTLEADPSLDLQRLGDLDAVNAARAIEVRLRAAALDACLTADEASALALEAHDDLGPGWLLLDETAGRSGACHEVRVEADAAWITLVATR